MDLRGELTVNGWGWVPGVYFAEGLPFAVATCVSMVIFSSLGMSNSAMAFWTGVIGLPWSLKFLWAPLLDSRGTKRAWMLTAQLAVARRFAALALSFRAGAGDGWLIACLILTAFCSATHDIAADGFYMIALDSGQQSFFVGIRSTFYRLSSIFGQGVLVVVAGVLEEKTGNIPLAWSLTIGLTAVIFTILTIYHSSALPRPAGDSAVSTDGSGSAGEFAKAFASFFRKPGVWIAIIFVLLYRLPEAFLLKMVNPFLLSPASEGGLGLHTSLVGIVYGTIGVLALTVGGIIGGMAASRWGLRKSLWPMAACMTLPCFTFVYLSMAMPHNLVIISTCIAVEQFGYGFGFTAYMLFMMYFAEGEFKTSHYAICTAFMALSMMIPGAVAGYIQEWLGYTMFFWMVIICCLATVAVTSLVKVDPEYGKIVKSIN